MVEASLCFESGEGGEGLQVATVVAGEAGVGGAVEERLHRRALVSGHRRPQLTRHLGRVHREAVAPGDPVDDRDGIGLALGGRAPVDRDGDTCLALYEQAGQLTFDLVGGGRDGVEIGLGAVIDDRPPVDHPLEPVLPDEGELREVDRPGEELDRPAADDGHGADHADEPRERVARARQKVSVGGIVDDGGDRPVEVDEHSCLVWLRRQRQQRRRQLHALYYCPTRTTQFTFSVPGSAGFANGSMVVPAPTSPWSCAASLSRPCVHCTAVPLRASVLAGGAS